MLMRSAISVDEVNSIINATIQAKEEKTNRKVNLITDE
jgi:DNA-directed RNA polymerase delta subunit